MEFMFSLCSIVLIFIHGERKLPKAAVKLQNDWGYMLLYDWQSLSVKKGAYKFFQARKYILLYEACCIQK